MPKTIYLRLPSGACVKVAKLTAEAMARIRELVKTMGRGGKFKFGQLQYLVDRQVVEVSDHGPYKPLPDEASARKKWPWRVDDGPAVCPDDWLEGDINTLCGAIYVARHGDEEFPFKVVCPRCTSGMTAWMPVEKRLEDGDDGGVVPYSDEFLEKYASRDTTKVEFDAVYTVDGKEISVVWRPLVGLQTVERQQTFAEQDKEYEDIRGLAYKLVELAGEKNRSTMVRMMRQWDPDEVLGLADVFAEHEGGIENMVEIDCETCAHRYQAMLPFSRLVLSDVVAQKKRPPGSKRRRRSSGGGPTSGATTG